MKLTFEQLEAALPRMTQAFVAQFADPAWGQKKYCPHSVAAHLRRLFLKGAQVLVPEGGDGSCFVVVNSAGSAILEEVFDPSANEAKALLSEALQFAESRGARRVVARVSPRAVAMVSLYRQFSFAPKNEDEKLQTYCYNGSKQEAAA